MIDEFLKRPFVESLIKMSYLRYSVTSIVKELHGLQKKSVLLGRWVQVYFYGEFHIYV